MAPVVPRARPLVRGLLSFIVPNILAHTRTDPLGTISAESCYSIFFRHLCLLHDAGVPQLPRVVAELGPGSSWGVGFSALLAGAETYYALDVMDFSDPVLNLAVFDQLVTLFRARAPIPASGVHSRRFPDLDDYRFPEFLGFEPDAAFDSRSKAIREDIRLGAGAFVRSAAPWMERSIVEPASIDWILSESVLEHVDDLPAVYDAFARWLKPGGHMTHLIDFGSHGLTHAWNGHWGLPEWTWRLLRGRRPYLINRLPCSDYARLAEEAGFVTIFEKFNKDFDGLIATEFADRFRGIGDEDARIKMVLQISRLAPKTPAR